MHRQPSHPTPAHPAQRGPAPSVTSDAASDGGWRARWRKYLAASMLGVAVVVAPAWPSAAQERSARRPAFERALSWRDFIRMRLSPWLLIQQASQPGDGFAPDSYTDPYKTGE
ncbi:MAG: hypothetical protein IT306_17470 [Chloroflexi bacterium]|nr:hypothetical protein [Chloroflexota bacterium]